jgi:tRNA threonylcarbamoyladenosine biosynthesis protein TsaB
MIVLSIDTTGRAGSAAIVRDRAVVAELSGDPAITHGQRLPGDLMRLLHEAGLELRAVDLLAVAAGPGSFTGLRIGIAAMQGLAMAGHQRIVAVSTLEALARAGSDVDARIVAPWIDAQRGEVFASMYENSGRTLVGAPGALSPEAALAALGGLGGDRPVRFVGDGAVRYAEVITAALGPRASIDSIAPRLAGCIALIAAEAPERAVAPHAVAPIYIRRPDAELARDQRRRDA